MEILLLWKGFTCEKLNPGKKQVHLDFNLVSEESFEFMAIVGYHDTEQTIHEPHFNLILISSERLL